VRGDSRGGTGDVVIPWKARRKKMASGDTIVASGRQIFFPDESKPGFCNCANLR